MEAVVQGVDASMAFAVNYICMLKTNTILPWKKTEVLKFPKSPHIPNSQKYTKALPNGQMVFAVCYLCKGSWTWITVIIPLVLAMPGSDPIGIFIGFPISLPFCLRLGSHLCPRWIILLCLFSYIWCHKFYHLYKRALSSLVFLTLHLHYYFNGKLYPHTASQKKIHPPIT